MKFNPFFKQHFQLFSCSRIYKMPVFWNITVHLYFPMHYSVSYRFNLNNDYWYMQVQSPIKCCNRCQISHETRYISRYMIYCIIFFTITQELINVLLINKIKVKSKCVNLVYFWIKLYSSFTYFKIIYFVHVNNTRFLHTLEHLYLRKIFIFNK